MSILEGLVQNPIAVDGQRVDLKTDDSRHINGNHPTWKWCSLQFIAAELNSSFPPPPTVGL